LLALSKLNIEQHRKQSNGLQQTIASALNYRAFATGNVEMHGRQQKYLKGGQRRNFAYPFKLLTMQCKLMFTNAKPFLPISACWSQTFVCNVFCTEAMRNAFSFNKQPKYSKGIEQQER